MGTDWSAAALPDAWVWVSLGVLLALLGIRAWVVETGHAALGRTPVRVKVLTGACALALVAVIGTVTVNGGAQLVYYLLHPAEAEALQDAAEDAADTSTAPPVPPAPAPGTDPSAPPTAPPSAVPAPAGPAAGP